MNEAEKYKAISEKKNFIALVAQMRTSQKAYFKTRSYEALTESKRLEKLVDNAIEKMNAPKNPQLELGL